MRYLGIPGLLLRAAASLWLLAATGGCDRVGPRAGATPVEPFNFEIASDQDHFQIEGYLARDIEPGEHPALLVLDPKEGNAARCIRASAHLTDLGIQVACISIPGYGASSGPSRFAGPQAVAAARRAFDLLSARPDVDPTRLGLWGLSTGALVAGLVMDSDPRPRAVVLQSGAYDMLKFWPEAPLLTKLKILHEVWPSRRVLKERSVMAHLPPRLDCSVLILHGEKDSRSPVRQAKRLEQALRERGARVETIYFPNARDSLGPRVERPLEVFLRQNLVAIN